MPIAADQMQAWCRVLLNADPNAFKGTLQQYLADIPRLESLANVPAGTPVLVRGDVDAKPGEKLGEGDIRLRSMKDTLAYGISKGWKQIVFGHIGRKPEGSLKKVAARIGEIIGAKATLITDWLDPATITIKDSVTQQIAAAPNGSVFVLENTRAYAIETVLWDTPEDQLSRVAPDLAKLANEFATKVAKVYVNEALSAGSLDASSTVVPAAMDQVALGKYVASEFDGPMMQCLKAQLVVFSGIKIDKLDDLEAMIARGTVKTVISAGSLAMALKKGAARLAGGDFELGASTNPANQKEGWYIPPERIDQAQRILRDGKAKGIEFVLPVDFVMSDGRVVEQLGPNDAQFDVGPKSSALFEQAVGQFIEKNQGRKAVAFHNGVFGKFEEAPFHAATERFIAQLKRLKDTGMEVYVGGGEGGTALERFGKPDWVTHCFTAGGTVLNALGASPVPYLVALRMAAKK